jgi:SPP1 family predicted phage head-tail adaptor
MLKGLRVGEYDTRITIRKPATTYHEETNEPIDTFSNVASVWAKELGPGSNERYEANQQTAQIVARFRVRWSRTLSLGLTERCIVLRGNDVFAISGIEKIGRNTEYVIKVEKRDIPGLTADDGNVTADTTEVTADTI